MDAKDFFHQQVTLNDDLNRKFKGLALRIASIRVVVFLLGLMVFVYYVNERELLIALSVLFFAVMVFVLLVKQHNKLKFSRDQYKYLADINREETARMAGDLSALDKGDEFLPREHFYAEDLDIFGDHSIFQLLNRTSTFPGKELLANRLLGSKPVENLTAYQLSVAELRQNPELMQEYQALGRHVHATSDDFKKFKSWLSMAPRVTKIAGMKYVLYILPALFIIGFALATIFSVTYYTLLPLLIVNIVLMARQFKYAQEVVESTMASLKMLRSFVHHIELLEANNFTSKFLVDLTNSFSQKHYRAKDEINKIAGLLEQLQVRVNLLHIFVNVPFLLDLQWLFRIEHWQQENCERVESWFNSLAEFEVISSLSAQGFSQNSWSFPELNSAPYYLQFTELGHPLIPESKRVVNNFQMGGKGEVILLTGPNMAGKSTFLRTIGVNMIMAKMGGVVCAAGFAFNPEVKIFTAMRIKDDLSESISSFYAELSRIKFLLDLVEEGEQVLYFLDEILKGTNSADRHKGADALMRQLSGLQVSGFVSTHDLELGELAKELDKVRNFSFESLIEDGKINFDYKLREGICQSFNACELMRQMGINV
jgi:ABC-type multidrug transport system fused ATPase/permease subunit